MYEEPRRGDGDIERWWTTAHTLELVKNIY